MTLEGLREKILTMVAELAELNGIDFEPARDPNSYHDRPNGAHSQPELSLMPSYEKDVRASLREHGCSFYRQGKGDPEIWFSPITERYSTVDGKIKSRHTANEVLKQAGIGKKFWRKETKYPPGPSAMSLSAIAIGSR